MKCPKCKGLTLAGIRCRRYASCRSADGSLYCYAHLYQAKSKARVGEKGVRKKGVGKTAPTKPRKGTKATKTEGRRRLGVKLAVPASATKSYGPIDHPKQGRTKVVRVRPLTLAEIEKSLPVSYDPWEEDDMPDTQDMRTIFGRHLRPLTSALTKKLGNRIFPVIWGQNWWNVLEYPATKEERMELIEHLKFTRVTSGGMYEFVDPYGGPVSHATEAGGELFTRNLDPMYTFT